MLNRMSLILLGMSLFFVVGCQTSATLGERVQREPPVAKVAPTELSNHDHIRTDDYYWLKERENPEVVAYLEAENEYTDALMAHTAELQLPCAQWQSTHIKSATAQRISADRPLEIAHPNRNASISEGGIVNTPVQYMQIIRSRAAEIVLLNCDTQDSGSIDLQNRL